METDSKWKSVRQKKNIKKQERKAREKASKEAASSSSSEGIPPPPPPSLPMTLKENREDEELKRTFEILQEYQNRFPSSSSSLKTTLDNMKEAKKLMELKKKRLENISSGSSPVRFQFSSCRPSIVHEEIMTKLMAKIDEMESSLVEKKVKIEDMEEAFADQAHRIVNMKEMEKRFQKLMNDEKELERRNEELRKNVNRLAIKNARLKLQNDRLMQELEKADIEIPSGDAPKVDGEKKKKKKKKVKKTSNPSQ